MARKCEDDKSGAVPSVFESMVAYTLRHSGIPYHTNVLSNDGLMFWDFVITLPLQSNKDGCTHVALELWNHAHVASNSGHPLSKVSIRTRLSKVRKVLLVPIPWFDWNKLHDRDSRELYIQAKLRSVGLLR